MANEEIGVLKRRYVLFSCEGTAEGVVIQTLSYAPHYVNRQ